MYFTSEMKRDLFCYIWNLILFTGSWHITLQLHIVYCSSQWAQKAYESACVKAGKFICQELSMRDTRTVTDTLSKQSSENATDNNIYTQAVKMWDEEYNRVRSCESQRSNSPEYWVEYKYYIHYFEKILQTIASTYKL